MSALAIDRLSVSFGAVSALSEVSLAIEPGEIVGVAGESGCGKSTLGLAVMGLLPSNATVAGTVSLADRAISGLHEPDLQRLRGREMALIVQDPMTALDPCFPIGSQVVDAIRAHSPVSKSEASRRAINLLGEVGIPDAERRAREIPARFSGGMRQRAVIACALANDPGLLIADEPTTALDVTIQAQVLALLDALRRRRGTAIMLISHDLGVLSQVCDRVAILYAGQLVEIGSASAVLSHPAHPYTQALVSAVPTASSARGRLTTIGGRVPDLAHAPAGCRFVGRCPVERPACASVPMLRSLAPEHEVACWHVEARQAVAS